MANANQVIVNGETILDLRSDTVTPETLQKGYTAHEKSGTKITGTMVNSVGEDVIIKRVTFNPSATHLLSNNKCVVTHNCGKIPKAVFIFSDNENDTYVGYGYIFNFSGSNDTTNVSIYTSFGFSDGTYRVAFTTTTMKFTQDSNNRYKSGQNYYFTFVC